MQPEPVGMAHKFPQKADDPVGVAAWWWLEFSKRSQFGPAPVAGKELPRQCTDIQTRCWRRWRIATVAATRKSTGKVVHNQQGDQTLDSGHEDLRAVGKQNARKDGLVSARRLAPSLIEKEGTAKAVA